MIKNYLKIAWRTIVINKTFSTINILGLALGIASSLLIMLWIRDEKSVDSFHVNGKQIFQVYQRNFYEGKITATYFTQGLLAEELKRRIPEIVSSTTLEQNAPQPYTFEAGNKILKMNGSYASSEFFSIFSYPLLQGNKTKALSIPNGITISQKMADEFFGSPAAAIGKTIRFENKENLIITAVFANFPANSSMQFDYLRNLKDYARQNAWLNSWGSSSPYTYIQLRKDADPKKVAAGIKDFMYLYVPREKSAYTEFDIQPFPEKYLHSSFNNGYAVGGRIEYVRLFTLVAVFILLIACINFMNLSTARSSKRAKEVGIRKVVGAMRGGLLGQFVGEAMLLTFFSTLMAIVIVIFLLPFFNEITDKQLSLPVRQPFFWLSILSLLVITGMISGSYPAFYLSSLKPISVLKGGLKFSPGASLFRKGLVVFQFSLSILLVIGMIVIYRQIDFVKTKSVGYDRENLVYIPIEGDLVKSFEVFKQKASSLPGIRSISKMKESPTVIGHQITDAYWPGKNENFNVPFSDAVVGYDFVKTMNLKLASGRDFSKSFGADSAAYIVNETALKIIGYKDPLGKSLAIHEKQGTIIGVLKDFHFASMHENIEPLVIRINENQKWGTILIRTDKGQTKTALMGLQNLCKEINPNFPFTYQFSDEEYGKLYNSEQVVSKLSDYFAFLAIFISCLGLFGLATFTAEQRTREIGVRKVLGASVESIFSLLSATFLKPVGIAMIIAFPVAWFVMTKWLQDFAYKISIEWWIFAIAGLLTVGIALLTVTFQSIKSALMNPVKSLRTE